MTLIEKIELRLKELETLRNETPPELREGGFYCGRMFGMYDGEIQGLNFCLTLLRREEKSDADQRIHSVPAAEQNEKLPEGHAEGGD